MVRGTKTGRLSMDEFAEMLVTIQKAEKTQKDLVNKLQRFVGEDGFSVLEDFPDPMAVYRQDGILTYVNHVFSEETGVFAADLLSGSHNILGRITNANLPLLDAVEQVFLAKGTFLPKLSDLLDIFISEKASRGNTSSRYQSAFLFPLVLRKGKVSLGAVIFMEEVYLGKNRRE